MIKPSPVILRGSLLVAALALALWSLTMAVALAQRPDTDRLENKIEQIEQRQQGQTVNAERRFGALQADLQVLQSEVGAVQDEIGTIKNLGIGIISAVALLIVQSLWSLILSARKPKEHH